MPPLSGNDPIDASLRRVRTEVGRLRSEPVRQRVVAGAVLVVLGALGFLWVLDAVREMDDLAALDSPVLAWLVAVRSPAVTTVLTVVTTLSGPVVLPIIVALGALGWGRWRREWWPVALLLGAMTVSTLVAFAVKLVVARPRPPVDSQLVPGLESTYSFPSGHTAGAATLALVLVYLSWVRRRTVRAPVLLAMIALVGLGAVAMSRLYLGYHFVTDVAASVVLAITILGGVVIVDATAPWGRLQGRPPGAATDRPPPRAPAGRAR